MSGHSRRACVLYLKTFFWQLSLIRFRYLVAFPLLAIGAFFRGKRLRLGSLGNETSKIDMRFHGLMLVRDEEDILPQCLEALLKWIDGVYIMDLGSTDATWQIVQEYALKDSRVVPLLSEPIIYGEGVRSYLFAKFRDRFEEGDWVMKVDADEFHHLLPPDFVRERVRRGETAVYMAWYFFRLTSTEVNAYETGRVDVFADRKRPIEQRRRMYKIADYAEPRMFRYRTSMRWPETAAFPVNAGYVARERIPIRHYPHRDPLQMEKRYRLRTAMVALDACVPHWKLQDWRKDVIDFDAASGVAKEQSSNDGLSASPGHTAGSLYRWSPGIALPEIRSTMHLAHPLKRLAQRIVHPTFLPVLDACRRSLSRDYFPTRIPENITTQLRAATAARQPNNV